MSTHKKPVKRVIVDTEGHALGIERHDKTIEFTLPIPPVSTFVDVFRTGLQFGLGMTEMGLDNLKVRLDKFKKVADEAIERGAKLEKRGIKTVKEFEHERVTSMKEYLQKVKGKAAHEVSIEARIEEALKNFDVPTRDDIIKIDHKITALDHKIGKTAHAK